MNSAFGPDLSPSVYFVVDRLWGMLSSSVRFLSVSPVLIFCTGLSNAEHSRRKEAVCCRVNRSRASDLIVSSLSGGEHLVWDRDGPLPGRSLGCSAVLSKPRPLPVVSTPTATSSRMRSGGGETFFPRTQSLSFALPSYNIKPDSVTT
jgi:hypothetical protein